jgi:hypothetical protein
MNESLEYRLDWEIKINSTSPIDPKTLNLIGVYLVILFLLCILFNSIVLFMFLRHKELRIPLNTLIISMTLHNLITSIQYPFLIHSTFNQR